MLWSFRFCGGKRKVGTATVENWENSGGSGGARVSRFFTACFFSAVLAGSSLRFFHSFHCCSPILHPLASRSAPSAHVVSSRPSEEALRIVSQRQGEKKLSGGDANLFQSGSKHNRLAK